MVSFVDEVARRRTFAIISHPDAGKTTLTEKLLYHGGVIHETGEVHGKSGSRAVTSDWMELERKRGISITSSVMSFDFGNYRVNLLDTPGHKDFSEDTYRVLLAVDSACMLIDVAKGVEERTKKLYEVCRLREIPVVTFINKLDRDGKPPLQLLDEVEQTLKMSCYPVSWPLGMGDQFIGLYYRQSRRLQLFREDGQHQWLDCPDPKSFHWSDFAPKEIVETFLEELEMIEAILPDFNRDQFLKAQLSPITWGSAKKDLGISEFLSAMCEWSPPPLPRKLRDGELLQPTDSQFSGFVFKMTANMDPRHRDRVAFIRVCSGKFTRGMKVFHSRLNREIRLSYSNQFLAQERQTVDEAYPGDILGVIDPGTFMVGDSIGYPKAVVFEEIPQFAPELFGKISVLDALKRRKLNEALLHLSEEGAIQYLIDPDIGAQELIVAAVGELQFEVLLHRLQSEYGLEGVTLHRLPFTLARWVEKEGRPYTQIQGARVYCDRFNRPVVLLKEEWDLRWLEKENPGVQFNPFGRSKLDTNDQRP